MNTPSDRDTAAVVNDALAATCSLGTLEVVAMGSKMGLSLECMADVLNKGAGRNRTTETVLTALARGAREPGPSVPNVLGALDAAIALGMEQALPQPLFNVARGLLQSGVNLLGEKAASTDLVGLAEAMAGARLGPRGAAALPASAPPGGDASSLVVGYVGLGAMGGALARRLMLSRKLHVFDARRDAVQAFEAEGAIGAADLPSLARTCDVIIVCLPTSAIVDKVLFGPAGLAEGLSTGKIVVDQTSGDPNETRKFAARLRESGVQLVDAPVSGGPSGAAAGTIAIMCGGEAQAFAAVRPILASISPNIVDSGQAGNGHVAKLVNNAVSSMGRLLTYEGAALALKSGVSIEALSAALSQGSGWSLASQRILPVLASGKAAANFQIGLMLKDVRLATGLGMSCGAPMAISHAVRTIFETGATKFGGTANIDEMARIYEDMTGLAFAQR